MKYLILAMLLLIGCAKAPDDNWETAFPQRNNECLDMECGL